MGPHRPTTHTGRHIVCIGNWSVSSLLSRNGPVSSAYNGRYRINPPVELGAYALFLTATRYGSGRITTQAHSREWADKKVLLLMYSNVLIVIYFLYKQQTVFIYSHCNWLNSPVAVLIVRQATQMKCGLRLRVCAVSGLMLWFLLEFS